MTKTMVAVPVMILMLMAPLAGDSWPAATTKEVFSESREWFVRVVPGKSLGDTFGFAGSPKGPYARAEFYRRAADRSYRLTTEITLDNPIAPVHFLVTDRGYLVTLDNWHNVGYGQILVAYTPGGKRVASYALKDLFSKAEIEAFSHSTSSIQWRSETIYVRPGQRSIYVGLHGKGSEVIFDPETGSWQQCEWRGQQHQCRDDNARRAWRAFREVG
jgi:hypothetical protein